MKRPLLFAVALGLAACGGAPETPTGSEGLVFARIEGESADLFRARLSDGAERAVTATPDRDELWPYWSEAAGLLVFQASAGPEAPNDLMLLDPDGGEERPLVSTARRDEQWPVWAPDGRGVAYAWRLQGRGGIAFADLESGDSVEIADSAAGSLFFRPHFAPDAVRIVAQRRIPGSRNSKLWILQRGLPPRPLTGDADWSEMKGFFTRDGRRIVFSRRPAEGGRHRVASIDSSGEDMRVYDEGHSARPSPVRDEMAYVVGGDERGSFDIFLADLDGENARPLTETPERNEFAPRWSPDGELLVVTTDTTNRSEDRSVNRFGFHDTRTVVLDREGRVVFETQGMMADWMRPWR